MKLIYFANVLDGLNDLSWVGVVLFALLLTVAFAYFLANIGDDEEAKNGLHWCKKCVIGIFLCSLFIVFCPTKREFYEIYGIGKTIEYIESNEQAKQLPDKVVNILDAWLDDYIKDEQKKSE